MKKIKILLVAVLLFSLTKAQAYYSSDSYEGTVTFTASSKIDDYLSAADTLTYINQQLLYLAGPLQAAPKKSGPKHDAQISVLDKYRTQNGNLMVRYQYSGTFVFHNSLQNTVTIYLPIDFSTIFAKSNDACFSYGEKYRYAYFWNPVGRGCNLVDGVDYFSVQASIARRPNTTNTMPSYERLTNAQGELRIIAVFGADIDAKGLRSPDNNDDYNTEGYKQTRQYLLSQGFSRTSVPQQVREQECGKSVAAAPGFVEEFVRQDSARKVVVRLFWGVANLGDESSAFYCMVKEAADKGSMFLYSGHSRVGGLDLSYMSYILGQLIALNPNQYQIFGFFGCSSYGYYNLSYFASKANSSDPTGSRNLDLISNGVAGSFYAMADYNIKTIAPLLNWSQRGQQASWQQIINSYKEAFLTGVNGDD